MSRCSTNRLQKSVRAAVNVAALGLKQTRVKQAKAVVKAKLLRSDTCTNLFDFNLH